MVGVSVLGFQRERESSERERELWRERDRGGSHDERERGSRLARRRGNGDTRGCGCHRKDFEDLGHSGLGLSLLVGLSPYRSTLFLSRSNIEIVCFYLFIFSFKE